MPLDIEAPTWLGNAPGPSPVNPAAVMTPAPAAPEAQEEDQGGPGWLTTLLLAAGSGLGAHLSGNRDLPGEIGNLMLRQAQAKEEKRADLDTNRFLAEAMAVDNTPDLIALTRKFPLAKSDAVKWAMGRVGDMDEADQRLMLSIETGKLQAAQELSEQKVMPGNEWTVVPPELAEIRGRGGKKVFQNPFVTKDPVSGEYRVQHLARNVSSQEVYDNWVRLAADGNPTALAILAPEGIRTQQDAQRRLAEVAHPGSMTINQRDAQVREDQDRAADIGREEASFEAMGDRFKAQGEAATDYREGNIDSEEALPKKPNTAAEALEFRKQRAAQADREKVGKEQREELGAAIKRNLAAGTKDPNSAEGLNFETYKLQKQRGDKSPVLMEVYNAPDGQHTRLVPLEGYIQKSVGLVQRAIGRQIKTASDVGEARKKGAIDRTAAWILWSELFGAR